MRTIVASPVGSPLNIPVVTTKLVYDSSIFVDKPVETVNDAISVIANHIADDAGESIYSIACDAEFYPTCITRVGVGSQLGAPASVRDIIRSALLSNATYITIVHNHPCGVPGGPGKNKKQCKPSAKDIEMVNSISSCCAVMGLYLYDSIIVQRPFAGEYLTYSMRVKSFIGKKWIAVRPKDMQKTNCFSKNEADIA